MKSKRVAGSSSHAGFSSLIELLRWRALNQPDRLAYSFLSDGETTEASLTYEELDRRARAIGAYLQSLNATGERALLLYPSGLDFIAAFFGCLYAGVTAVPTYSPDPARLSRSLPRFRSIVNDAGPFVVLTVSPILSMIESLRDLDQDMRSVRRVATDAMDRGLADEWHEPEVDSETLAFLQYTSGSTAAPKGVMVTHSNVLHNERMIRASFDHTEESTFVGWLPLFHDMGLIGNVLQPLYVGSRSILLSPEAFLQKPLRWLQAVSRYKAATSGGPNFAYDLCVRKISDEQRASLDLSSWTVAFNGSEPVRHETIERFSAAFEPCGFRKEAFCPCYGLAEATLFVAGGPKQSPPVISAFDESALKENRLVEAAARGQDSRSLTGCGRLAIDLDAVIVNTESLTQCATDHIGEIWLRGPNMARGYWGRPDETRDTFEAYLSDTGDGPFMRTGDLGFLRGGELFVTGRLKDLIIIRGRNHYPQDIELTAERSHPALRPGCGAAFSVEVDGEERLVLAQEVSNRLPLDADAVIEAVRRVVAEEHEIQTYAVVLLEPGSIPKTSSGKIQRQACRARYMAGGLEAVAQSNLNLTPGSEPQAPAPPPQTIEEIECGLVSRLATMLGVEPSGIDPSRPIAQFCLDSLMAVELAYGIETSMGVNLPMANFLENLSVAQIAAQVFSRLTAAPEPSPTLASPERDAKSEHPLSHGQRALWFLHKLAPHSAAYNIMGAVRIRSRVDSEALRGAFQSLIDRHPSLRTNFTAPEGSPIQSAHDRAEVCFQLEDASRWDDGFLNGRLIEDAQRPFNLEQGALLRVTLFTRSARDHVLLMTMHHIIADLWSLAVMMRELGVMYQAKTAGEEAALPPIELEYVEYIRQQIEMLSGPAGDRLWQYWQEKLAGDLPVMNLPTDKVRPPVQTYNGASIFFKLEQGLTQGVKSLAAARAATPYMTLLATFQALLYRYTAQEDILVGSPTAGRGRADLRGVVGYFVNPVVMRARPSASVRFDEFLGQVRQTALEAFEHQDFQFQLLVERLQPVRDLSRSPIFQVMFVWQKSPLPDVQRLATFALGEVGVQMRLGDLLLESTGLHQQISQFDLSLSIAEADEGLAASFEYNTDLFEADTVGRMVGHFQRLLESIVADPAARISDLDLLSKSERQQILFAWNDTDRQYIQSPCIHLLFERQVERSPEAIALAFEKEELTYRQLNSRANQVAHRLRSLGVGPDVLVGLCMERSLEMMVGMLGIIKAGGAYVPLDKDYPPERLALMLDDARVPVLLTQQRLLKTIPARDVRVICLDSEWETVAGESEENPVNTAAGENLVYVIYTSGSTGSPKGVMVQHRSLVSYAETCGVNYEVKPGDRVLQFCSISFDISGEEIYPCLTHGAALVLRTDSMLDSVTVFLERCREWGISVMSLPTAYWHQITAMLEEENLSLPPSLRMVVIAGERAFPERLAAWQKHAAGRTRLMHTYGPTEATISVSMCDISEFAVREGVTRELPIGSAIPDAKIYILDTNLQPVPVGVQGEVYLGGALLARGYHGRPDTTADRFIPNPFALKPGERMYRSGDLARYLPDANLEFLGRVDQQVKIRGFRVELEEIETVLRQHRAVRDAVILAQEYGAGNKRLVGFVVPDREHVEFDEHAAGDDLQSRQAADWREIFNDLYRDMDPGEELGFYIKGWTSSYSDTPIPGEEVREWMDQTVERILSLRPSRVYEIGSGGSGLMLLRVAPSCEKYYATDQAVRSLELIQEQLKIMGLDLPQVSFKLRGGDNFQGVGQGEFDAVLIVSVAQYFPSVDYLMRVLEQAVKAVAEGGHIFLGDVRNLSLLEAFHTSVQLHKSPPGLSKAELLQQVQAHLLKEKQLVIDPEFFIALKHHLPEISHVEILLMRGRNRNELSKFRYDVILHVGGERRVAPKVDWIDWETEGLTVAGVRRLLRENGPDLLAIKGVPNARVTADVKLVQMLKQADGPGTAAELMAEYAGAGEEGIDPEDIWAIGDEEPYSVSIGWSESRADGRYEIVFQRRVAEPGGAGIRAAAPLVKETVSPRPWGKYATAPLQGVHIEKLVPILRSYLEEKLPEYMVPSSLVLLDALPLSPNGKVDRRALHAPGWSKPASAGIFAAPRTPVEEALAKIWMEVLGLDRVSIYDDFSEMGGHSLLAMQLLSRVHNAFGVELSVRALFESPTVAGLAQAVERALRSAAAPAAPQLSPASRDEQLPLSFAQQRLWFLSQLEPDRRADNMPGAIRIEGRLDVSALGQSLNELVRRHESLRTRFVSVQGQPLQVIAPELKLALPVISLTDLPAGSREAGALKLAEEEAAHVFDLAAGPLLLVKLLRLDEDDHLLILCLHHIVSDGWSLGVFAREMGILYDAFSAGRPSPLPELPIQYADFAVWQRGWLQGELLESQLSYWRQKLSGDLPVLELPTDRPRAQTSDFQGSRQSFALSEDLTRSLKALSKREGVTMFMTLLCAFKVLLHKYTRQEDIIVGTPIAGRNRAELEGLIGFFVNTLVLRTDLSGRPSFTQALARERDVCLDAYAHQDLPFEMLVDELQPERQLSRNPIFQAMFEMQTEPTPEPSLMGLKTSFVEVERTATKFDLTMALSEEQPGMISGWIEYKTELFDAPTIERMAGHFQRLLEAAASAPATPISALPMLSEAELHHLLVAYNDTRKSFRGDLCVHQFFEEQVERTPDNIAIMFEGQRLTFRELNARANRLAHYLRKLGVGPETPVGMCMERSPEMFVGLLGILKSGGAYVPVDPSYPKDRVAFMLEDAGATTLLTQERLIHALPEHGAAAVCVDSDWGLISQERDGNPVAGAAGDNLAYVLYTSGSTGRPKGVAIEHRQLVNYMIGAAERLGLAAMSSFALVSTPAADLGNTVIFPSLCNGGCLHVISEDRASDADAMSSYFRENSIDCLKIVPSHLASLRSFSNGEQVLPRKMLVLGGEASQRSWVEQLGALNPDMTVINHYGPTETTVGVLTYHADPRRMADHLATVPLGYPLPNAQVYLLNGDAQPVPAGVPAEIHIGGAGLARGYFKRPDLTAEKFIPNPFGGLPGERLYKTGDLARHSPDGAIEFLGRMDDQVKVRGFRVELSEIESVLRDHHALRSAVVLAAQDGESDRRLVAYVVAEQGRDVSADDLRAFLKERLPEYMVPSRFLFLDAIPLTPNGKVDRRSLPAPDQHEAASEAVRSGITNPVEEIVANVWAKVLGLERVGAHENFFEVGGNSLLATQAVSRLRAAFQTELPLRKLFESPTVAALAEFIRNERGTVTGLQAPPIEKSPSRAAIPLSYSQWRLWFLDQLVPNNPVYNVSVALRLSGPLDATAFGRSINEVVRRHDILRTTFSAEKGQPVQLVAPTLEVDFPVVDLSHLDEPARDQGVLRLAAEEARRPFDLTRGPLLRTTLVRLGEHEHVLILAIHHIVSDDWSVGIFNREISALYRAFLEGLASPLPALPIQYADFAVWQRRWLDGPVLEAELEHWKRRLGDDIPALDLPTDRPRPAVQAFRGATLTFEFPESLSRAIKELSLQQGSTLFMTLLAAYAAVLHRCSGQEKIIVGLPIANRNHIETEGLIGFFTNILVPPIDLSGDPTYKELINRVREATLDAFDHQDMPFEKMVEVFQQKRDLSRPPLRQVAFAFENSSPRLLDLPGVTVSRIPFEDHTSRLDLTVFIREEQGKLRGALEYNSDLFEASTARRFLEFFEATLEDLARHPERRILTLPPLVERRPGQAGPALPQAEKDGQRVIADATDAIYEQSNMAQNQLLFWFSKKLQPDVQLYFDNVLGTFAIEGAIDVAHFRAAFQKVVDHSDALRSTIVESNGAPRRIEHQNIPFEIRYVDLSGGEDPRAECAEALRRLCAEPLDLGERLFDSALFKLSQDRFVWFLSLSHMIADLWSVAVISRSVSEYYLLSLEGRIDDARPLPPYAGYIEYEREFRRSAQYGQAELYWKKKLATAPNLFQFYRRDSSAQTTRTRRVSTSLGAERSQKVKQVAGREGLFSPAVVFAATLFAYQHRVSGERRLRIGSPFANRPDAFRQTPGLFINVCPLEISVSGGDSFASLAGRVQVEILESSRNQMYPVRNSRDNRVYNVYFNYQSASLTELCGLHVEFDLVHSGHSNDTLTLQVRDFKGGGDFVLDFDFNCGAFDEEQSADAVRHFLAILDSALEDWSRAVRGLRMLSEDEQRQVLVEFNQTNRDYPRGVCLHEMVEAQAARTPRADAVIYGDRRLSYAELNRRANQLAHFLRRHGVGPDVRVGVCAERSLEMVIGLLGILKAGGAYVPLDPAYPKERLTFMLDDARVPVLLTQGGLAGRLPEHIGKTVCLDSDWDAISRESEANLVNEASGENLAYVIYTSGSTGKPKGAMIPHRGICNRLLWMQEAYHLTGDDRVLQKTPFSFDVSVWEFFWPLITGACVVMARPDGHQDRQYLIEEIARQKITTIHFVPSMLQLFLAGDGLEACYRLKRVVCSGEALPYELQQRFFELMSADLHNLYGPTEASVDVTYWECGGHSEAGLVPIGRPIANTNIYILDGYLDPAPVGIPGVLHIGGEGLARGYLKRPGLTAEKFIPDPFSEAPGARLYDTGDLARYLPDGNIEFLGRIDHQVKIRGFRIELGEIEEAIRRNASVREAVVVDREDRPGDKRLVAYVVAEAGEILAADQLRGSLKERLPDFMIPSAFVALEQMPLTPNGKIDRKALPAPDQSQLRSQTPFASPRSPLEELLAGVWADVLGVERVGVHDDFFEMGGQSILATQLISKIQQVLPIELPLRTIFESPTVAQLAVAIEQSQQNLDEAEMNLMAEVLSELKELTGDDVGAFAEAEESPGEKLGAD
jgi:amino acid adenylation domain-containing protein